MNSEQIMLAVIRDTIAQAPAEDREIIEAAVAEIRVTMAKYPGHSAMAIALVGAEIAVS
jgi:antibiotic biosynthesis monooxygenase (ABM) superfamily enzyme